MNDRDPIQRLKDAWRAIEPPERGDGVEDADAQTQATVKWLRDAWSTVVPAAPTRRRSGWRVLRTSTLGYAAAALLLIAIGASLRFEPSRTDVRHDAPREVASDAPPRHDAATPVASDATPRHDAATPVAVDATSDVFQRRVARDPIHLIGVGLIAYGSALTSGLAPTPSPPVVSPTTIAHDLRMIRTIERTRRGEWSLVAEAANEVLRLNEASCSARCEALYQLALSFEFLGRPDESMAYRSRLERELALNR